jgi:hypothetical protein
VLPASFESRSANMSGGTFSLHPTTNYNAPHRAKSYTFYTLKKKGDGVGGCLKS